MSALLIYTHTSSPRLTYVIKVIFDNILQINYELTSNKNHYIAYSGAKINYSPAPLSKNEIFLPSGTILFEKDIKVIDIAIEKKDNLPFFFAISHEKATLDFDFFGMCFYLLSRYEEYLPFTKDRHGRFTAKGSLAYKNGFLRQPLINQWTEKLRHLLNVQYKNLVIPKPIYHYQATYDIDRAWAFKNKGYRFWGGMAKAILKRNWEMVNLRQKVMRNQVTDPFYSFDFLQKIHQKYELSPIWFFLLGDEGRFDKNTHWENENLQKLIQNIVKKFDVGIHPSYASNVDFLQVKGEIKRLQLIVNQEITKSRQHYLKLSFPSTYRALLASKIKADYTLGYAEDIGFRGSIATPFPWYDLEKEEETHLVLHPFMVMDVTLKKYLQLSPAAAVAETKAVIDLVKAVGGTFTTLWHNSSFSVIDGWEDWGAVYEQILDFSVKETLSLH